MTEAHQGGNPEDGATWEALDKKQRRKQAFLDLVQKPEDIERGEFFEDAEFFLTPGQVFSMFKETYMGVHMPEPDELVVDIHVSGLMGPGYYRPVASANPDKSLLRRAVIPSGANVDWNRQLGVAFQFDTTDGTRTVTAESECGILLSSKGFKLYRRSRILVNDAVYIVQPAVLYKCSVAVVDEFTSNVIGIAGAARDLGAIEQAGPARANSGTMPVHDPPFTPDDD